LFIFAVVISLLALLVVLVPFFRGEGGMLSSASFSSDPERLQASKAAIIERYIADHKIFKQDLISKRAWTGRQELLINKYVDASRRLDFVLNAQDPSKAGSKEES
jgi:hypothetical protein